MKYFNKKLIVIPSVVITLLSSLYVGTWLVIATHVKATISKALIHIDASYNDNIQITGFPFTPKIKILNLKINLPSLNIYAPSVSLKYRLLSDTLEFSGENTTLKSENSTKIINNEQQYTLNCQLNDKFNLLVKPSKNLILSLLDNKNDKKAYFSQIIYEDNGISCNNNNITNKNSISIKTNEHTSPDNLLTMLQYKINANIIGNSDTNTNIKIKDAIMTLTTSDTEFKEISAVIDNIGITFKKSLISIYGTLLFPLSMDYNKTNNEGLTIEISGIKDIIRQLVETISHKSNNADKISYILQNYIYSIAKKKENGNILLSISQTTNPFNIFICKIPYEEFINKIKLITNTTNKSANKK
ncbi:hypothetical protein [Ehrlichia canis]|uniref:Uncharacterized protein n=1 Tax=Ehrlichia canis (strain Jake) TaxID=269484 RepID=A0ACA6AVX0_EHRCJ|nr:hypothetical protein [Ehrlichia canis]AAZ68447.1 hypothetical protein Ecaj_0404 [Ehrlichia canis str. Jake]AUO54801.1 hypothetical protein C1I72_02790 [Ehrlichia canis]UKC53255.1 hypothetical protein s20019040002_000298 [Ehrlichia canis]UKC54192.1 hypothetical protein s20026770001_000298 [Ehrlichia canis]UKC55128.1 hypothetical protein s21009500007_000298 [Ehrlichia canis]